MPEPVYTANTPAMNLTPTQKAALRAMRRIEADNGRDDAYDMFVRLVRSRNDVLPRGRWWDTITYRTESSLGKLGLTHVLCDQDGRKFAALTPKGQVVAEEISRHLGSQT